MAIMCSLQSCVAKAGMCWHEKVMFGIAVVLAVSTGAYFLLS